MEISNESCLIMFGFERFFLYSRVEKLDTLGNCSLDCVRSTGLLSKHDGFLSIYCAR